MHRACDLFDIDISLMGTFALSQLAPVTFDLFFGVAKVFLVADAYVELFSPS